MVADSALDFADGRTEIKPILLGERGHEPHQREMREVCGFALREILQCSEGGTLSFTEQAALRAIEHQQHAPARRKFQSRDERRIAARCAAAAVDHETAVLEGT